MKKFLAMAAALTMSLSVAAAASAEKYQMTFSTAVSQEQSSTIYMDKALDLITERTNGDVTFSRTYSGTLGSEHDLGVMCQSGDIDIVCIGPGQWSDWDEAFKVFDCPFLFTSFDHFDRVLASEDYQAWLKEHGDAQGVTFVMTFNQAFKGILNKNRDVYSTADLAGLKLRVPDSASLIEIGTAMGYVPTPTAAADQYMSLSQGIVDGADHALWAHQTWKLTEIAKHYSDTAMRSGACSLSQTTGYHSLPKRVSEDHSGPSLRWRRSWPTRPCGIPTSPMSRLRLTAWRSHPYRKRSTSIPSSERFPASWTSIPASRRICTTSSASWPTNFSSSIASLYPGGSK